MTKSSEIYSQGYQKWEGERQRAVPAWVLIGKAGVRNLVSSTGCLSRTIFLIYFIVYYFWIIAVTFVRFQIENLKKIEFLAGMLGDFKPPNLNLGEAWHHKTWILWWSLIFCGLIMVVYGAQLIAKDKNANALQVYFSKAVSRWDYVLGKFFAIGIMTSTTTLIPSALILMIGLVFAGDQRMSFLAESWYIPFLTGLFWLMFTLIYGSITLFFSSCFNKTYLASVTIVGFLFFSLVFVQMLEFIFGSVGMIDGFNIARSIVYVGEAIFDREVTSWSLLFWRALDLGILVGVFLILLLRRVRPVEVVQ